MSLVYSNTTTKNGILQICERRCGFNDGDITGNATRLAQFTGMCNMAMDAALSIIFELGGTWQFDDTNHTDYPFITTSLVAGQRDYTITSDAGGNLILDVYKVMAKDTASGPYYELIPVDQQSDSPVDTFWNGLNQEGNPTFYDKTANAIILDLIPPTTIAAGLKVFINRESTYFTTSDTTKKPGFDGLCHEFIPFYASHMYTRDKVLAQASSLEVDLMKAENKIRSRYGRRERDIKRELSGCKVDSV